jgi:hypothetical protein
MGLRDGPHPPAANRRAACDFASRHAGCSIKRPARDVGAQEEVEMKASKKKPATRKAQRAKLEDLTPKTDPKGGFTGGGFTGGVFVAAGDVNGDGSAINGGTLGLPAVQNVTVKIERR